MDGGATDWNALAIQFVSMQDKQDAKPAPAPSADLLQSDATSAPQQAPQTGGNLGEPDWNALAVKFTGERDEAKGTAETTARSAAVLAAGGNPDKAAQARDVGKQIGLPGEAVATDPDTFKKQADAKKAADTVAASPALTHFLANDPGAAALASDDFENLSTIGKLWESVSRGAREGVVANTYGRLGSKAADLALQGQKDAGTDAQRADIGSWLHQEEASPLPGVYGALGKASGFVSGIVDNWLHSKQDSAAGAMAGAAAGAATPFGIGVIPGAIEGWSLGTGVGMARDMARVAAGQNYNQLSEAKDETGKPYSETAKQVGSAVTGALTFGIGSIGLKFGGGEAAVEAISKVAGNAVQEAMARPTVAKVIADIGKESGKGALSGAALNAAMTAANQAGEMAAQQIDPGQWKTAFNDPAVLSRYGHELANAAEEGFMMFGAMHAGISGLGHVGDIAAVRKAQADVDQFQQLEKGVADSKLRGRAPDVFLDYLKAATGGEATPLIGINGDRLHELYQSYGIDPFSVSHDADPLFHFVEDMPNKLHQAMVSGGDVHIPTADYATHIAGTKIADELRPDLNFDPMNPASKTLRERVRDVQDSAKRTREGLDAVKDTAGRVADESTLREEAVQRVTGNIYDRLKELGFGDHRAAINAALIGQRYQTRSERNPHLYPDAWAAFTAEGMPTIRKQDAKDISGVTADHADVLINALRSKNIPTDRDIHGKSLLQFIKERGGIIDTGGELRAMDLHKSRPGLVRRDKNAPSDEPGLFREPTGYSGENKFKPDMVAEAAHQAGYIPEHSIDHLYDAIREEVGGRPRYVEENKDQNAHDFRAAVEDLDRFLGERGIDVDKHDNAAIKAMIAEHQRDGGEGGELFQSVWHGSPHTFDRFDLSKIGTGEGAQAYGHGLYFAGKKEIAEYYRDNLSANRGIKEVEAYGKRMSFGDAVSKLSEDIDRNINHPTDYNIDAKSIASEILDHIARGGNVDSILNSRHVRGAEIEERDAYQVGVGKARANYKVKPAPGRLYHVDIPDEGEYLLWDKPLSEQPDAVKGQLKDYSTLTGVKFDDAMTGKKIYQKLMSEARDANGARYTPNEYSRAQPKASEELRWAGIRGIKYLDANSRDGSGDSHNYVLFDDKDAKIIEFFQTEAKGAADRLGYSEQELKEALNAIEEAKNGKAGTPEQQAEVRRLLGEIADRQRAESAAGDGAAGKAGPSDAGSADTAGRGTGAGDSLAHGTGERLGSISSMEHDPVITLFRKANQSTFSHEMGHKWLVEMLIDAEHPEASDLAKADAAAALKYLGATDRHSLTVDQHEQWARTVETYLMEGKAPSDALSRVLRQFKDWLTNIYKKLTALDVPINDEIRGVMDRLLASDDAIDAARKDAGAQPLFREKHAPLFESAKDIGMTDPQYRAYLRMIEQAQDVADKRVMAAVTAKLRRERTAAWKEESAAMRPGVEAEMMQRPDLAALACLQDGRNPVTGAPMPVGSRVWKLSRGAVADMHGTTEAVKMLPHGTTIAKGGIDPDIAASALGYRSGDRLIGALMELEAKRKAAAKTSRGSMSWADFREKLINDEVDRRMTERHGDPLHDGSIENEALQAVHSKAALDIVSAELKALANKAGVEPPHTVAQIAEWVRGQMGDEKAASGANTRKWVNAERKASRAAEEALLKKNYAEAYKQKQRQQIAMLFAKQSFEIADALASGRKMFTRMAGKTRLDSIAPEYADRIHELLGSFGFNVKRDPAELQRGLGGTTLEGFVNGKQADGAEFAIAPWLFDKTQHVRMADITVDQFLDLKDAITSLAHVGRREQEIVDNGKLVELERLAEEASQAPGINRGKDNGVYMHPENLPGVKGDAAKWGAVGRSFDGMLLKMEQLFQWFDRDTNGPFTRLFDRLKACQHGENDRLADLSHKLDELGKSMPKGWEKDLKRVYAPEDHPELMAHDQNGNPRFPIETRAQLLAAALNVGNRDNFNKLVLGFRWAVSHEPGHLDSARARFMNVLNKELTEHDWRFVQGVWDLFETMAPEIDAMQRRVTGVGMTKVVADPVVTKSGILRGGYYPVVYDPKGSAKAARNAEGGELKTLLENNYYRATTSKGHTKARVENVQMPLLLALDNIPAKLRAHAHDLHWREAITDADRLLGHEKVRSAIASDWGHEYAGLMRPWLQSVANEAVRSDARLGAMDGLLRGLRINTMIMGIGFRVSTILKHGLSALSMSVSELGPVHSAKAIAELFGGSKHGDLTVRQMIMEKSGELRHRMNTIDRDVREALRSVEGQHDLKATMAHWGHLPVAHADLASAMFVWLGGYRKALAEGAGEELAVSQADRLVRNAHGAQGALDLSGIQRGPEALKLMTMFYGFFNHNYNRGRDMIVRAGVGMEKLRDHDFQGAGADFGRVLANSLGYLVIPAIVEAMVSEGLPNDENEEKYPEWLGKALVGQVAGDIPILRDIAKGILTGRDYQATPMESLINSIGHDAKDIARATGLSDGEPSERWLRHAIETPGFLLGLPLGQPAVAVQYLWDIERGYSQPDDAGDFMKGLAFGTPKGH